MAIKNGKKDKVYLTVILPVFNEEENILLQYEDLIKSILPLKKSYEVMFVDDGSTDNSFKILQGIAGKNRNVKVVQFRRNFGQASALAAGIDNSHGEIVIIMDSDLQNDAEDIRNYISKIEEGYEAVSGWRMNRKDKFFSRKVVSKIANWLIRKVSGVEIHDLGSSQAYRGDVLRQIRLYGEMHRFIPVHASWIGAKITEIPVKHHARKYGKSKYGLIRTFKVLLDLIVIKFFGSYSTKPIHFFGGTGFILLFVAGISGIVVVLLKIFRGQSMIRNPLLLLTVMLIILSFMFVLMGILAEFLTRIYHETRHETPYKIRTKINL